MPDIFTTVIQGVLFFLSSKLVMGGGLRMFVLKTPPRGLQLLKTNQPEQRVDFFLKINTSNTPEEKKLKPLHRNRLSMVLKVPTVHCFMGFSVFCVTFFFLS